MLARPRRRRIVHRGLRVLVGVGHARGEPLLQDLPGLIVIVVRPVPVRAAGLELGDPPPKAVVAVEGDGSIGAGSMAFLQGGPTLCNYVADGILRPGDIW